MGCLSLRGITKYFPTGDILANDSASLRVERGSIHALVGENGAGKTTLMRVLYGLEQADEGSILLDDKEIVIGSPQDSARYGIGMVHQHFMTVDDFTVTENIILGREPRRFGVFVDPGHSLRAARAVMDSYGLVLDPEKPAGSLTVGERQTLEILRLLYRKAGILILDEPTAVLTEQETRSLFDTLRQLRRSGHTVIIITHKVREVKEISDEVTVMRAGRTVGTFHTADVSEYDLSCLIMGNASCPDFGKTRSQAYREEPALVLKDVTVKNRRGGVSLLDRVNLVVRPGEIVGVCGVRGNGMGELEDLLAGFRKPDSGSILLAGKPLPEFRRSARPGSGSDSASGTGSGSGAGTRTGVVAGAGLGYVPADRMRRGASLDLSVRDNFIALDRRHYSTRGFMDWKRAKAGTDEAIRRFGVKAHSGQRTGDLSGGNIQKLILARELSDPPAQAILFSDPAWGLDLASTEAIYEKIVEARDKGAAILLISSNLDEILALADRVLVMYRGRIAREFENDGTITREALGAAMLGMHGEA